MGETKSTNATCGSTLERTEMESWHKMVIEHQRKMGQNQNWMQKVEHP